MNAIERQGFEAQRNGVVWWNNPFRSGSVEAFQWDRGHTLARQSSR